MVRPIKEAVADLEWELIDEAMTEAGGNVKAAAELLSINRSWLNRRIASFGIDADAYRAGLKAKKKKKKARGKKARKKPGKRRGRR